MTVGQLRDELNNFSEDDLVTIGEASRNRGGRVFSVFKVVGITNEVLAAPRTKDDDISLDEVLCLWPSTSTLEIE